MRCASALWVMPMAAGVTHDPRWPLVRMGRARGCGPGAGAKRRHRAGDKIADALSAEFPVSTLSSITGCPRFGRMLTCSTAIRKRAGIARGRISLRTGRHLDSPPAAALPGVCSRAGVPAGAAGSGRRGGISEGPCSPWPRRQSHGGRACPARARSRLRPDGRYGQRSSAIRVLPHAVERTGTLIHLSSRKLRPSNGPPAGSPGVAGSCAQTRPPNRAGRASAHSGPDFKPDRRVKKSLNARRIPVEAGRAVVLERTRS